MTGRGPSASTFDDCPHPRSVPMNNTLNLTASRDHPVAVAILGPSLLPEHTDSSSRSSLETPRSSPNLKIISDTKIICNLVKRETHRKITQNSLLSGLKENIVGEFTVLAASEVVVRESRLRLQALTPSTRNCGPSVISDPVAYRRRSSNLPARKSERWTLRREAFLDSNRRPERSARWTPTFIESPRFD